MGEGVRGCQGARGLPAARSTRGVRRREGVRGCQGARGLPAARSTRERARVQRRLEHLARHRPGAHATTHSARVRPPAAASIYAHPTAAAAQNQAPCAARRAPRAARPNLLGLRLEHILDLARPRDHGRL
eukprot:638604-Prymnesium_polylepis.2